jgi:hypothetical protein
MRDDIEQRIRERAYHMWRENGCSEGESDRHWLAAEREVLAAFAASAPTTMPRRSRGSAATEGPPEPKTKSRSAGGARRRAS